MSQERFDVLVIGGGPAGSTAANLLAAAGHRVRLLEKHLFPRPHVGEGLLPFCYSLFERVGVLDQMQAEFVRKPGVRFVDSEGLDSTIWCFDHIIHDDSFLSFHVDRARFDEILLRRAATLGARVEEGVRVIKIDPMTEDGSVLVHAHQPGGELELIHAPFVIDASGRDRLIARSLQTYQRNPDLRRTALWAHWKAKRPLREGLEQGLSLIAYLGGRGWVWVFPLSRRRLTVGIVVDNDDLGPLRGEKEAATDFYHRALTRSPLLRGLLEDCVRITRIRIESDYSYDVSPKFSSNYALIGDAGGFIDPIFSSGVYLSMKTASLVADTLDERLSGRGPGDLAQVYERVIGAYSLIRRLVRLFYNPNALSFAAASGVVHSDHELHRDAMAAAHFLLAGDFFDNHPKYTAVLDLLSERQAFGKFRQLVLRRSAFKTDACNLAGHNIFPRPRVLIRAMEPGDVQAVAELVIDACRETCDGVRPELIDLERQISKSRSDLENRGKGICGPNLAIDLDEDALVGIVHGGRPLREGLVFDAELYALHVRRDWQHQGLDGRLLAFTVARMLEAGMRSMSCYVPESSHVHDLYTRVGGRLVDKRFDRELGGEIFTYAWDDLCALLQTLEAEEREIP